MPRFDWSDKSSARAEFLARALTAFPDFKRDYETSQAKWARNLQVKAKFNGQLVSSITGLAGKELGAFMNDFKRKFGTDAALKDWVLASSSDEISARISCAAPTPQNA